jgi:NAD(P)-dependent dehydrogenase (short-subunit alcohol dehydrogenase family)
VTERLGVVSPGRVAVVTGAASGIGLGLSERFVAEGMNVVMADVEEPVLLEAAAKLSGQGAAVLPVVTDVSSRDDVEALRDAAVARFGAVHVLCNNAGVGGPTGRLWLVPDGDWQWVLGVNLGGVINGIRAFVPLMLEQARPATARRAPGPRWNATTPSAPGPSASTSSPSAAGTRPRWPGSQWTGSGRAGSTS